ncbi:heat-shock protein [Virgibacillus phasianinus]|uniref:Heat-shock protein n=1 Tax=Virgibacillus phasianinus TaxID=2017483 RepID=A0A220U6L9_9BACI|nr:Hsp20/alpha crystallin family protein [Virgibacillus phasianinus]ASK63769.1 heat-shock protein [Virgibacillus phasianinus]
MGSYKDNLSKWLHKSSFQEFIQHMDSFFDDTYNQFFKKKPFEVNMYETETNVLVKAILPGYSRNQIKLAIIGNQLRITAEGSKAVDNDLYHTKEDKMERTVSLPFTISKENTKAIYRDGVLKITTPIRKPNTSFIDIDEKTD